MCALCWHQSIRYLWKWVYNKYFYATDKWMNLLIKKNYFRLYSEVTVPRVTWFAVFAKWKTAPGFCCPFVWLEVIFNTPMGFDQLALPKSVNLSKIPTFFFNYYLRADRAIKSSYLCFSSSHLPKQRSIPPTKAVFWSIITNFSWCALM